MNESAIFGEILIRELARDIRVLRNTHRFAGFAVLKSPDTPSVLMELGYLSSPRDENMFRKSSFYKSSLSLFLGQLKTILSEEQI